MLLRFVKFQVKLINFNGMSKRTFSYCFRLLNFAR